MSLFNVLAQFSFITNKRELDYYHQELYDKLP